MYKLLAIKVLECFRVGVGVGVGDKFCNLFEIVGQCVFMICRFCEI